MSLAELIAELPSDLTFDMCYMQCLAAGSYMVGHGAQAVVIDPLRDVDQYLKNVDAAHLSLKAVLLSHLHADYVGGHRELAERGGGVVVVGAASGMEMPALKVSEGDVVALSAKYRFRVLPTPGHTPGCITYVLQQRQEGWKDLAAFTGDTLFIGSCGRPDLVASLGFSKQEMATAMFHSLEQLKQLDDDVLVLPAHGAGSPCGKALSSALYSTIGQEKRTNPALLFDAAEPFAEWLIAQSGTIGAPQYFGACVAANMAGSGNVGEAVEKVPRVALADLPAHLTDALVVDGRSAEDFAALHVRGSVNMPLGENQGLVLAADEGNLAIWVGTLLTPGQQLVLVPPLGRAHEMLTRLARVGYVGQVRACLSEHLAEHPQLELVSCPRVRHATAEHVSSTQHLDVRTRAEYDCPKKGHVQGALSLPLAGSAEEFAAAATATLDPAARYVAYCSGGFRSAIAASLLRRAGYDCADLVGGYELGILPTYLSLTTQQRAE